jgi:hypothetical protein
MNFKTIKVEVDGPLGRLTLSPQAREDYAERRLKKK